MNAKELNEWADAIDNEKPWRPSAEQVSDALLAYASLLAAVESSGEEIVQMCEAASRDERLSDGMLYRNAAARIVSDAQEIAALKGENEKLREACAAGWGEPALINTLKAELAQARTTSQFHKDNHLAAEAELASVKAALKLANDSCRSAYQVAARKGVETNWEALQFALQKSLNEQHKVMYPEQYTEERRIRAHKEGA